MMQRFLSHPFTGLLLTLSLMLNPAATLAAPPAEAAASVAESPQAIMDAALRAGVKGPQELSLANQAKLKLPEGRIFIAQPHAAKVMRAMGNPGDYSDLVGLVMPADSDGWFATLRFEPSGYIKDDDAKHWDADGMLAAFREGTEASNSEREKLGVAPLEITGWAEVPAYAADSHRLVWAMSSRNKGAAADAEQGVNYNTYALGREGYLSLNLVTDLKDLPQYKGDAQTLLAAIDFNEGKRYADFNNSTDKVAEYGLAALVLGVGAKKLGLLAVVFAFVAKFAKVIFLAVAVFGGSLVKFFRRKKPEAQA